MVKRVSKWEKFIHRAILLFICMFLYAVLDVQAAVEVRDKAELFTGKEIEKIQELASEIDQDFKMNVLVFTTDSNSGKTSREKIENEYEKLRFASNGAHGGIAFIIDLENRELNLVSEGDMRYYITDEREERIYDEGYEYAGEGEYGKSMYAMLDKSYTYLKKGIPNDQYLYDSETGKIVRYRSVSLMDVLLALIVAVVVAGIAYAGVWRSYRVVKKYGYPVSQNADMRITGQKDRLVNQYVTERRIPKNDSHGSSGHGSSGRTTTHTSSGGHSYGGGHGRKF